MRTRAYGIIVSALALGVAFRCGRDEQAASQRTGAAGAAAASGSGAAPGTGTAGTPADPGATPAAPADPKAAKNLFTNVIEPAFEKQCASCHAEPRIQVPQRGPLTIFIYDSMRKLIVDGPTSSSNKLIDKMTNTAHHDGGKRCELTAAPCADVVKWRKLELGADADTGATRPGTDTGTGSPDERAAALTSVTSAGKIYGWAVNKASLTTSVALKVYLDGPLGTGTLAVSTTADKVGDDGNNTGNHAFFVQMPAAYLDGKAHPVYLYDDKDTLLTPKPETFKAWSATVAGKTYFDTKIAGMITSSCDGCHASTYAFFYPILLEKGPNEGGTAMNNVVINKPATANGTSHSGGNRCGGVSGGVCAEFQKWWDVEFPAK